MLRVYPSSRPSVLVVSHLSKGIDNEWLGGMRETAWLFLLARQQPLSKMRLVLFTLSIGVILVSVGLAAISAATANW